MRQGRAVVCVCGEGAILKFLAGQFYFYANLYTRPPFAMCYILFDFNSWRPIPLVGYAKSQVSGSASLSLSRKVSLTHFASVANKSCAQSVDINFVSLLLAKIAHRQCTEAMRYYYPFLSTAAA